MSSIKSSSWNKRAGGWAKRDHHYYKILMHRLPRIIFFWVGPRRWNVNKSIRARSWGLQLPLLTIKRLFMLPWRAIPVTLAHWREPQIILSPPLSPSFSWTLGFFFLFLLPPLLLLLHLFCLIHSHKPLSSIPPFLLQPSLPSSTFCFFSNGLHHNPFMLSALPQLLSLYSHSYSWFFTAP